MSDAPIPNYDELRPAEIESHARGLDQGGLEALIGYESRHADRIQGDCGRLRASHEDVIRSGRSDQQLV